MKKSSSLKNKVWLPVVLCLVLSLAACGNSLSDKFEKEEVREKAEEMITSIHEGNLEEVYQDSFTVILQNSIELEDLQESVDYVLDKLGEFQSFEKVEIKGAKDKNTGTEYAVAVVLAKYQEGKAMFTISFDTDMLCGGFYIK